MSSDQKQRTYGNRWSPVAEDLACCVQSVWCNTRRAHFQCANKRGKGAGGLYCGIHDPAAVQARRERSEAKHRARIESDPLTIARKRIEALEGEVADLNKRYENTHQRWDKALRRVEALEGEVAKLLGLQAEDQQSITDLKAYIRQADARAERLRVALESIAYVPEEARFMPSCDYLRSIARKALEDDKPIRAAAGEEGK
jgi:hypothetical protein